MTCYIGCDLRTRKNALAIPLVTLLLAIAILLNVPIFREIIVFAYLSFIPGFVTLKAFKLRELGVLNTFLVSIGLSLFALIVVGLLVNELYVVFGLIQPLSVISLTIALSSYVLVVFFIGYRRDFSINFVSLNQELDVARKYLHLIPLLIILPIISIVAALYVNVLLMTLLTLAIVVFCILSVTSDRIVPRESYPLLILSISISILLLNLLISKYTIGDDASIEYYIFKVTQNRGYWAPLNEVLNSWQAVSYNSDLSITLLPNMYSVLTGLKNELLFKILYSFVFSLVPVTLYGIFKKETNASIGLLSRFFFIFTLNAFFGELISLNRQIIAEFFLVLSILIWLNGKLPLKEKRILLIIFGLAISLAHYSLAIIYIIFISIVVFTSSLKSKFDDTFNGSTILTIFGITFLWYALGPGSPLTNIINVLRTVVSELTTFRGTYAGSASSVYAIPEVFTTASWINLVVTGAVTLSLAAGIIIAILFSKKIEISNKYKLTIIFASLILAASYLLPRFAASLNFTRFYAITMLILSPCFVIGASSLLKMIQGIFRRRGNQQKNSGVFSNRYGKVVLLLVSILLCAYFFSQSGFVNHATGGAFRTPAFGFDYYRLENSSTLEGDIIFYSMYPRDHDAFSAYWLSDYSEPSQLVYVDALSMRLVISCGLVPQNLLRYYTNETIPGQGSLMYLSTYNIVKDKLPASTGLYNTSDFASNFTGSLIYSNGNSEIWKAT